MTAAETPKTCHGDDRDVASLFHALGRIRNRLMFRTNSHTIIPFVLGGKKGGDGDEPCFSLQTLARTPQQLMVSATPLVVELSLGNAAIPILDDSLRQEVVAFLGSHYQGRLPAPQLEKTVAGLDQRLDLASPASDEAILLRRLQQNYRQYGYFSHIDWRLDHWACAEDIDAVVAETFTVPTPAIEFFTLATPPILALQLLANTFPSVHFTLQYGLERDGLSHEVRFHPFPPFGY